MKANSVETWSKITYVEEEMHLLCICVVLSNAGIYNEHFMLKKYLPAM